jgi:RHS repeat-associated protein
VRTWGDGGIYDHVIHYDVASKKTIVENSLGHATVYEYNIRNRVTKVMDAVGAVTEYADDPDTGGTIEEVSPSGGKTLSRYDAFGMLTSVTNALGHTTRIEYDPHHQPSKAIDVRGGEWQWTYDAGGRLTERTLPTGARVSFVWERGLLSKILDPRGQSTELVYDDRKQVTELVLPNGGRTKYEWDELGRVVKTKNAREGTARFQYDAEGRLLESYSMVETLQQHAYDAEGNLLEARDPNRHVKLGYEHFHRVAWREEDGTRLRFEYDTEDRVTAVVNEAGERYTFELDPAGRVVKETGFDGRAREYVRDIAGRPTLTVLPSGRTTSSTYDVMNRLVEAKHSDKTFAKFEYAVDGLLTRAENEASVVEMERDSLGRVVRETVNGRSVHSAYDASGDRTEMTSSLGARVVTSRDALGQPREMYFGAVDGFKEADVRFDRDGLGLESRRAFKNGIEVEWSRDVAGRPTARRTFKKSLAAAAMGFAVGMLATPSFAQPQREEVDARVYQWRGEDQIAGIVDAASGPKFYDHDARGRLVRERRPDAVVERAMDAVGNVYRSRTGTDRRYGPGGRLEMADGIRYEHDEDGNQTLKSGPDGDWHYRWNGHGMLREVERPDGVRVAFDYDPFARRTAKRTLSAAGTVDQEVQFVWDGHNVIHELDSDRGLISWQWEPESFTPIAKEHNGRRWTIASDHLGTPTEMYDDLGQLAWKMQLDVFGVPSFEAGTAEDCPWRWPGQYEDGVTGLFYNRWRYYSVATGEYAAFDPLDWTEACASAATWRIPHSSSILSG